MASSNQKIIDWDSVEIDYRAGVISVRAIGVKHGVSHVSIHKRAKRDEWNRELKGRVNQEVARKLITGTVNKMNATVNPEDEEGIVESAANQSVAVIESHRNDIKKLRELEMKFLKELAGDDDENPPVRTHISSYQGEITQTLLFIPVTERAGALNNLANVQHKRIVLERRAWGLNDDENGEENKPVPTTVVIERKDASVSE